MFRVFILVCSIYVVISTILMLLTGYGGIFKKRNRKYSNIYFSYDNTLDCFKLLYKKTSSLGDIFKSPPTNNKTIFFQETSCRSILAGKLYLTIRQACAVESAAFTNPNFDVRLLVSSPTTIKNTSELNDQIIQTLLSYNNIKINHVNIDRYFRRTPVEELYMSGKMERSKWPMIHLSDVMRFVTLWRFGGIYLDTDMIVLKSLDDLEPNFAGIEGGKRIGAGVIHFEAGDIGHFWVGSILKHINNFYRADGWSYNANGALKGFLQSICKTEDTLKMDRKTCQGFGVYPQTVFYPISYKNWRSFFKWKGVKMIFSNDTQARTVHLWNNKTTNYKTNVGLNSLLELIAKTYCPKVYSLLPKNSYL